MTLALERTFEITKLCQDIISYDHVFFVAAINKNGRIIDSKFCNDSTIKNLSPQETEMFFMQRMLQVSLSKEFEDKIGSVEYITIDRIDTVEIMIPLDSGLLVVISRSEIIPRYLAKKILLMVKPTIKPISCSES